MVAPDTAYFDTAEHQGVVGSQGDDPGLIIVCQEVCHKCDSLVCEWLTVELQDYSLMVGYHVTTHDVDAYWLGLWGDQWIFAAAYFLVCTFESTSPVRLDSVPQIQCQHHEASGVPILLVFFASLQLPSFLSASLQLPPFLFEPVLQEQQLCHVSSFHI